MAGKSLTLDEFRALAGTEVGVSDWIEVPQEKINAFAEVSTDIAEKAIQLDAARAAKDFATADAIRNELQAAGFVVESTKDGTRVRRA